MTFKCVCKPGFEGLFCEKFIKRTTTRPTQPSPSTSTPGGTSQSALPSPSSSTLDGDSHSTPITSFSPDTHDATTERTSTFSEYTPVSQSSVSSTGITPISESSVSSTESTPILGSSVSSTTVTTTKKLDFRCNFLGYYDDGHCDCLEHFFGRRCEFVVEIIRPGRIIVKVKVTVTVWNVDYHEELKNTTSEMYKDYEEMFKREMDRVYPKQKIPSYVGVENISFSNGSIVIKHTVLLNIYAEEYDETISNMENIWKSTNCTDDPSTGAWCFKNFQIEKEQLDLKDFCKKYLSIHEDFRQYFVPKHVSGIIKCVSHCSPKSDSYFKCKNGACLVTRDGPSCYCYVSDQYWYHGEQCQVSISKPGVIAGVTVGLAVLLIIIVALSICLCLRRKRRASGSLRCRDERWHEHGWETDGPGVGAQNPRNGRSRFQPTLANVDTDTRANVPRPTSPH